MIGNGSDNDEIYFLLLLNYLLLRNIYNFQIEEKSKNCGSF